MKWLGPESICDNLRFPRAITPADSADLRRLTISGNVLPAIHTSGRYVATQTTTAKFSKSTEYALRAVIFIRQKGSEEKKPDIPELVAAIGNPAVYGKTIAAIKQKQTVGKFSKRTQRRIFSY